MGMGIPCLVLGMCGGIPSQGWSQDAGCGNEWEKEEFSQKTPMMAPINPKSSCCAGEQLLSPPLLQGFIPWKPQNHGFVLPLLWPLSCPKLDLEPWEKPLPRQDSGNSRWKSRSHTRIPGVPRAEAEGRGAPGGETEAQRGGMCS